MSKADEVAKSFVLFHLDGVTDSVQTKSGELRFKGYNLYSYDVPIAWYNCGHFYVSTKKYSTATSKHQNAVVRQVENICPTMLVKVNTIEEAESDYYGKMGSAIRGCYSKTGSEVFGDCGDGDSANELREQVEAVLKSHLSQIIGQDYVEPIFDSIKDDVVEDIRVCADNDRWCNGDLHLAIGRVLCNRLGCEI